MWLGDGQAAFKTWARHGQRLTQYNSNSNSCCNECAAGIHADTSQQHTRDAPATPCNTMFAAYRLLLVGW
jgi:hypothetical protein